MNYNEYRKEIEAKSKDELVADAINAAYNDFASKYADCDKKDDDAHGHGKKIAYIGWYYRSMDFAAKSFTIADCGDFIGFCENNKWGYDERSMTSNEADKVIGFFDEAMTAWNKGGMLSDMVKNRDEKLGDLWDYLQSLSI